MEVFVYWIIREFSATIGNTIAYMDGWLSACESREKRFNRVYKIYLLSNRKVSLRGVLVSFNAYIREIGPRKWNGFFALIYCLDVVVSHGVPACRTELSCRRVVCECRKVEFIQNCIIGRCAHYRVLLVLACRIIIIRIPVYSAYHT